MKNHYSFAELVKHKDQAITTEQERIKQIIAKKLKHYREMAEGYQKLYTERNDRVDYHRACKFYDFAHDMENILTEIGQ